MQAGPLDRRVTLLRLRPGARDAMNAPVELWDELATVRGSKTDVSDAEKLRAAQAGATITTRFRIRWSQLAKGLTAKDRLSCEGRTYDVSGVREIGRHEGLEITGNARGDA
jgi:SPP1 family predicted phage head-tail adaptor